jgi:hypothetical protein
LPPGTLLPPGVQDAVRVALLKGVEDASNDVKNAAVKTLSKLVVRFEPEQISKIVDTLSDIVIDVTKNASRDIVAEAVKSVGSASAHAHVTPFHFVVLVLMRATQISQSPCNCKQQTHQHATANTIQISRSSCNCKTLSLSLTLQVILDLDDDDGAAAKKLVTKLLRGLNACNFEDTEHTELAMTLLGVLKEALSLHGDKLPSSALDKCRTALLRFLKNHDDDGVCQRAR